MTPLAAIFIVTAYGLGCDAPGPLTKAGTRPVAGFTVAADPSVLPIGSIVMIESLGERMVHDVGGKIKGHRLDVFMTRCVDAVRFGVRRLGVAVLHTPVSRIGRLSEVVCVLGDTGHGESENEENDGGDERSHRVGILAKPHRIRDGSRRNARIQ